jgi:hypothetical protein
MTTTMEVSMKAGTRIVCALACALAVTAVAAIPAGASSATAPTAKAAKSACSLSASEQRHLGASYVYTLNVTNLSCDKGKRLVKKFHECRHANGGADGHCNSVKGYSCNTKILDEAPTQFSAKAKCEKGSKSFKQTFGENT